MGMPSLRTALGIPAIPDVPVTTTDTAVTRSSHHADISISSHQAAIHQQTTTTLKSRHPPPPPPAAAAAAPKVTSTDPEKQAFQQLLQETAQKSQSKFPRTYRQLTEAWVLNHRAIQKSSRVENGGIPSCATVSWRRWRL